MRHDNSDMMPFSFLTDIQEVFVTKKEREDKWSSLHHALLTELPTPIRTPVWFMRQAGRSLPEYRALRQRTHASMLECCLMPDVAALATLQPVRRHGVDAAILFSDIMTPLLLSGVDVHIDPGVGPTIKTPAASAADIAILTTHSFGTGTLPFTGSTLPSSDATHRLVQAVTRVINELGTPSQPPSSPELVVGSNGVDRGEVCERSLSGLAQSRGLWGWTPLIAFAGAPFTLAAYLVEGKPSRDHLAARGLMLSDHAAWDELMRWCATVSGEFLALQIEAGASVAQLFDSWAGSLSPELYEQYVAPYSALTLEIASQAVSPTLGRPVPVIHFGTASATLLPQMASLHPSIQGIGVDERIALHEAQPKRAMCVQGNINPAVLRAPWEVIAQHVDSCMEQGRNAAGHIVNLGHGVPKDTDPQVLTRIVARVHGDPQWAERVNRDEHTEWNVNGLGLDVMDVGVAL